MRKHIWVPVPVENLRNCSDLYFDRVEEVSNDCDDSGNALGPLIINRTSNNLAVYFPSAELGRQLG
jgi:hypothetical protein